MVKADDIKSRSIREFGGQYVPETLMTALKRIRTSI